MVIVLKRVVQEFKYTQETKPGMKLTMGIVKTYTRNPNHAMSNHAQVMMNPNGNKISIDYHCLKLVKYPRVNENISFMLWF